MGTNFYYLDGRHVAKTSATGRREYQVFWAIDPDHFELLPIIDEYGHELTPLEFMSKVAGRHWDRSTIGEDFS